MKVKITGIHENDGFSRGIFLEDKSYVSLIGMTGSFKSKPGGVPEFKAGIFKPDIEEFANLPDGVTLYAIQYEELPNDT